MGDKWIAPILGVTGVIIGAFLAYWLRIFEKKGKLILDEFKVTLRFRDEFMNSYIANFFLNIQFINTSGKAHLIRGIEAKFYDGEEYYKLAIQDHYINPSVQIPAGEVKCFDFTLIPSQKNINLVVAAIHPSFLEVRYRINDNKDVILITKEIKNISIEKIQLPPVI